MTLKYGMLTVIKEIKERSPDKHIIIKCRCACGNITYVKKTRAKNGYVKSCGCLSKINMSSMTHGMKYSREYSTWQAIKTRCYNKRATDYPRYGGGRN